MSKTSIILELQSLATDRKNDITDLLRKSLLVASKLKLDEFKTWVNNELQGYKGNDVPEYRKTSSEIKLKDPYHGLIPVVISDQSISDILTNVEISDPIESLDNLLKSKSDGRGVLTLPFSHSQQAFLMERQDTYSQPTAVRIIGRHQVAAIVDAVRTTILEWALQLESEGILGDGISFSEKERNKDVASSNIKIKNFQGVLGDVNDSNLKQYLNITINKNDFESLSKFLESQDVATNDLEELKLAVQDDPTPTTPGTFGSKVSAWVGKMIENASNGSWSISIGAAGNLLATAISKYYGL